MKRYHFNIGGKDEELGICGAIMARTNAEALDRLQKALDEIQELSLNGTTDEVLLREFVSERGEDAGVTYVNLYTNEMKATMKMFDEIEPVRKQRKKPRESRR